ncbi:tetratricopeptide repeat protein, partial [Paenactinomyces guangxiensis]
KLRQEDLADNIISQVVVSNIETGKTDVSEKKIIYLFNKLGLKEEDMNKFYIDEEKINQEEVAEELELRLESIETIVDLVDADQGLAELRCLPLPPGDPFIVVVHFLKGKGYLFKGNLKKSRKHFFEAIRYLNDKHAKILSTNLKSLCYYQLSRIEYLQNDLHEALEYCKKGISSFIIDGKRKYTKHLLLLSKAIYLQKLNRLEDAQTVMDQITTSAHTNEQTEVTPSTIDSKEIALNLIELQATIWAKGSMYTQAIKLARQGIELARIDQAFNRSCELWITLGSIYSEKDKFNLAEICFLTALKLKDKIQTEYLLAYAFTQLGTLYSKREEFSHAEDHFLKAVKISRKINDAYQETEALMGLGSCYVKQKMHEKATKCLHEALDLAKQHSFMKQKNQLLLMLGHYLKNIGNPHYQQYALDFFFSNADPLFGGGEQPMLYSPTKRQVADPPNG